MCGPSAAKVRNGYAAAECSGFARKVRDEGSRLLPDRGQQPSAFAVEVGDPLGLVSVHLSV